MTELDPARVLIYNAAIKLLAASIRVGDQPYIELAVKAAFDAFAMVEAEAKLRNADGSKK